MNVATESTGGFCFTMKTKVVLAGTFTEVTYVSYDFFTNEITFDNLDVAKADSSEAFEFLVYDDSEFSTVNNIG